MTDGMGWGRRAAGCHPGARSVMAGPFTGQQQPPPDSTVTEPRNAATEGKTPHSTWIKDFEDGKL